MGPAPSASPPLPPVSTWLLLSVLSYRISVQPGSRCFSREVLQFSCLSVWPPSQPLHFTSGLTEICPLPEAPCVLQSLTLPPSYLKPFHGFPLLLFNEIRAAYYPWPGPCMPLQSHCPHQSSLSESPPLVNSGAISSLLCPLCLDCPSHHLWPFTNPFAWLSFTSSLQFPQV